MKQSTTLKKLVLASCVAAVGMAGNASAQIHPLAFGPHPVGTATSNSNFYKDYVGTRFLVNSPASVAGEKRYTTSYSPTSTTSWGAAVTAPLVNLPIAMSPSDSLGVTSIPAGSMAGKIAFIYRGTNEFVCKAVNAVGAGASAIVIVNNIPGGPIGMGPGTTCSAPSVTIPVFMISKEDGDAIRALYRAGTDTARLTITPWGIGAARDLGFVPGGTAEWHNYAIPKNQLGATGNPAEYNMASGAFIANYGSQDATNVKLSSTLSFTPDEGGVTTMQHTDTVTLPTFRGSAQPLAADRDSIYAMFSNEYSIAASGKGRFDLAYHISSTSGEDYPADNSYTTSFYTTDSLYSKSRYNFTANTPIRTQYFSFGTAGFIWGPMYYVKNGGTAISRVQYALSNSSTTTPTAPLSGSVDILLFKWTDGQNTNPTDSIMQDGELSLVSLGSHLFDGINDTPGANLNFNHMGDPNTGVETTIRLDANSWYYLGITVPSGHFLGTDGVLNPYPRIFGRFQNNSSMIDYSSVVLTTAADTAGTNANAPSPSSSVSFVNSIDSFVYSNQKGLIPSVAMIVNNNPPPVGVHTTPVKAAGNLSVFPNPATNVVNVALNLDQAAKVVNYTVVDGLGRLVSRETRNNVQNETFEVNTSSFKSGHYFLIVSFDGKAMSKEFVIIK